MENKDQLRDWLRRFIESRKTRTYSRDDANHCLDELVNGDTPDIIDSYLGLIKQYLENKRPVNNGE